MTASDGVRLTAAAAVVTRIIAHDGRLVFVLYINYVSSMVENLRVLNKDWKRR